MPDVCTYFGVHMTLKYKIWAFQRRVPIVQIPLRFVSSAPRVWLAQESFIPVVGELCAGHLEKWNSFFAGGTGHLRFMNSFFH